MSSEVWGDSEEQIMANRRRQTAVERRAVAASEFPELVKVANAVGLNLQKHSDSHYSLRSTSPRWQLNIYPGNLRLHWDHDPPKSDFPFPEAWTLTDVVQTVIRLKEDASAEQTESPGLDTIGDSTPVDSGGGESTPPWD